MTQPMLRPLAAVPGHPYGLPAHYGDAEREYAALRSGAIVVDQRARGRGTFAGEKTAEVLAGLVTSDVLSLASGEGQYAAALTPKGKVIADLRIFSRGSDFLVDIAPLAQDGWWQMIRKYVNPRLSRYTDVRASMGEIGVYGVEATAVVAAATGIEPSALAALPVYGHTSVESATPSVLIARVPDAGLDGFALFVAAAEQDALENAVVLAGGVRAGALAVDAMRIEAGRPEWGIDMDDNTIAQEANLDELHAISFTKGCYTGQETVARVHFRGHVNRHLRGLKSESPLTRGVALLSDDGATVGEVRSGAPSPRFGHVALGMVRREVSPGATLRAGDVTAEVVTLPFAAEG